jgi:hypothetical protein
MDLGASPARVLQSDLPLIIPGIVAAGMLSFALSLDDFIITYFVSGSTVTYPLYVNAAVKAAVPPQINVLATGSDDQPDPAGGGNAYRRKRIEAGWLDRDLDAAPSRSATACPYGTVELCDRAALPRVAPPRLVVRRRQMTILSPERR